MKMKKIISIFMLIVLTSTFAINCFADDFDNVKNVIITGKGSVDAPADTVSIHFEIESRAANESDALRKSEALTKKIITSCNSYGETSKESFCLYEDSCTGKFVVSKNFILTSKKTDKVDLITEELISNGVSYIGCVNYSLESMEKYEKEALSLAIKDAENRASSLGINLKINEIKDFGSYCCCCGCLCEKKGYETIECTVNLIYK